MGGRCACAQRSLILPLSVEACTRRAEWLSKSPTPDMESNRITPHKFSNPFSPPNRPDAGRVSGWPSCRKPCELTTGGSPSTANPARERPSPFNYLQQNECLQSTKEHINGRSCSYIGRR